MKRGRGVPLLLQVVLILLCLTFLGQALVYAQGQDRSISKTGPATATNHVPFDYTLVLTLPPGLNTGFVFTETLTVGGSGGTISYEVLECPFSPCPPNPIGDISELSESPITGTIPVGNAQPIMFAFLNGNGVITSTITTTHVVLVRVTPNFSTGGVITNTVTLPPDSNPSNNSAGVVTNIGQPMPVSPVSAPALRDWGMLIMVVMFGGTAFYFMRRRKSV